MTIQFGLTFDSGVVPLAQHSTGGTTYMGPAGLLRHLELLLGLSGHANDIDYLRVEQYRQAMRLYCAERPEVFFARSFAADQFAAAAELLARRDELCIAGWDFTGSGEMPPRLACLADIEAYFSPGHPAGLGLSPGFSDRFLALLRCVPQRHLPVQAICLNEPLELLPGHFRRLFAALAAQGAAISQRPAPPSVGGSSDLALFQAAHLHGGARGQALRADGSLLVLRARRETTLAAFLAQLLKLNPDFRPHSLVPEQSRTLDNALIQEGLPSLGIRSQSQARPSLQVLKLAAAFLWQPIDPFKLLEFVSLAVKPLETELANRIGIHLAEKPGLGSDSWTAMVHRYFDELGQEEGRKPGQIGAIRRQYEFWFQRKRYHLSERLPKQEAIAVYAYIKQWAFQTFDESNGRNQSLLVLSEQARRITELLEALPETALSFLELERIVRTIYEPSPVTFRETELGGLPYTQHTAGVTAPLPDLLWWNFTRQEPDHFFSRWYSPERSYLAQRQVDLQYPADENALLLWQRSRPLAFVQGRLLLVLSELYDGAEVHPHLLYGDLEATFGNLDSITCDLDTGAGMALLGRAFQLPGQTSLPARQLGRPKPFLQLPAMAALQREEETLSGLETLFYYPYQWMFRHQIYLRKSAILSVVPDVTLKGNLAHRFIEELFKEDVRAWGREQVSRWIDDKAYSLLSREGAVLLMYGREPERSSFLRQIKDAAWSLLQLIQQNGWEIAATELPLEGEFAGVKLRGRADLVLARGEERAIIDIKWRGAARRERVIRNEEDLQLVLYAKLLEPAGSWAHTAYFVMENGRMIARNETAFRGITATSPGADHIAVNERVLARMEATYHWRMAQIRRGQIEVRCRQTIKDLEDAYGDEDLMPLLEMRAEDAPFDDYRTLINLVE